MRFPRRVRLTEPAAYQRVFKHTGCRLGNRWITLLVSANQCGHARIGTALSRKVVRNAVARNRIKRLIRESFRHWQGRLGAFDIVVLGKPGIADQSGRVLDAALEKLWEQLLEKCAGSSSK